MKPPHFEKNNFTGQVDGVFGLQYGDEAKAKLTEWLARNNVYNFVTRFCGADNAGHTIVTQERKIVVNQIPSGFTNPDMQLAIGPGSLVNPVSLMHEIKRIEAMGFNIRDRLHIAANATVIQPAHLHIDAATGGNIGTTLKGIGAAYADAANRRPSIKAALLAEFTDKAVDRMEANLADAIHLFSGTDSTANEVMAQIREAIQFIGGCIKVDPDFMDKQVDDGARVLMEGAQAFGLDVTRGCGKYVTAGMTTAASAMHNSGISDLRHKGTFYGVAKAIMTRVGYGPFVSEYGGKKSEEHCMAKGDDGIPGNLNVKSHEEVQYPVGEMLASANDFEFGIGVRQVESEYGATTSRPRRVGVFDCMQARNAARGVDVVYLTKVDSLQLYAETRMGGVPIMTEYTYNGQPIDFVPPIPEALYEVSGNRIILPGFTRDITDCADYDEIPDEAKNIVDRIEKEIGKPIWGIGNGPGDEQLLRRAV